MNESILQTIKEMIGNIDTDDNSFNTDLIVHINSLFFKLRQLGYGPKNGFSINGPDEVWTDFTEDISQYQLVKTYIYLEVKLVFDAPTNSSVLQTLKEKAAEYEWRIKHEAEFPEDEE